MDAAKLEKLREIQYTIAPQCGHCLYSNIRVDELYGVCKLTVYEHTKHDPPKRQLSIRRDGVCLLFVADEEKVRPLEKWAEFFKAEL